MASDGAAAGTAATVVGYYLLVAMGNQSALGRLFEALVGHALAFSFGGLVFASVLVNIPFAVQPVQRAFGTHDAPCRTDRCFHPSCTGSARRKVIQRAMASIAMARRFSSA